MGSNMAGPEETAHVFECDGEQLVGILHRPGSAFSRGVVVVVGGPQYRVGSHRQFLLLARYLAKSGIAVFRFDYRGMGDSSGEAISFLDCGADLRTAVDVFVKEVPELSEVVIWGLCDAATAAAIYAPDDARITGLVLLNPWARSERSQAATYLRHYYIKRLFEIEFWRRLVQGQGSLGKSVKSLVADIKRTLFSRSRNTDRDANGSRDSDFRVQMLKGLQRFAGHTLFVISELDLTAREFTDMTKASVAWQKLLRLKSCETRHMPGADHTFSKHEDRHAIERLTESWLRSW